ncbi:MAG: hypothetical protein K0A99_06270 [Desulfoarculaceae bacterium]|nr:hypothetical protein [Desulfoarculaceae bacterium]
MKQQVKTTSSAKNVEIFWGKYLDILRQRGIKESAHAALVREAGRGIYSSCRGPETA